LEKYLLPLLFLVFFPFLFTFQINDMGGGFRKEIIFLAFMAYIVWSAKSNDINFNKKSIVVMLIYPFAILSHELMAVFLPYLIAVYFIKNESKISWKMIISLLITSIISLIFTILYKGNKNITNLIYSSLDKVNYHIDDGAKGWLKYNSLDGYEKVINAIQSGSYFYYLVTLILVLIAFIPIYKRTLVVFKHKITLILIIISLISSLGQFLVAIDLGRWIYIHAVAIFLVSLLFNNTQDRVIQKISLKYYFSILLIYSLFWHIPHGGHAKGTIPHKVSQINIFNYAKTYVSIKGFYFPDLNNKIKQVIK